MKWKRYLGIGAVCLGLLGAIPYLNNKRTERLEDKIYKEQERLELVLEKNREREIKQVYDGLDEKTKELVDLTAEFIKEDSKRQVCEKVSGKDPKNLSYPFNEACNNKFKDVNKRLENFIKGNNSKAFKEFFEKYTFFNYGSNTNGGYLLRNFGSDTNKKNTIVNIFGVEIDMNLIQFRQLEDTAEEYSQGWKKDLTSTQILYKADSEDKKTVYINEDNLEDEAINFFGKCQYVNNKIFRNDEEKIYFEVCNNILNDAKKNYSSLYKKDKNLAFIKAYFDRDIKERCIFHEGSHLFGFNKEVDAELSSLANNPSPYMVLRVVHNNGLIKEKFENKGYNFNELYKLSKENNKVIKGLTKSVFFKNYNN